MPQHQYIQVVSRGGASNPPGMVSETVINIKQFCVAVHLIRGTKKMNVM